MSDSPQFAALGIDFGTSNTVAVLRRPDGRVETLLFDGAPQLPSTVFATADGRVLTGRDAVESARLDPARAEQNPKRRVDEGTLLLGDGEVPVGDLIAAVLERVRSQYVESHRSLPDRVCLTYPANWGPSRRLVLLDAAAAAGLSKPLLVPEPVAAAAYLTETLRHDIAEGAAVVVYDFGAGTFDASVVRRAGDGFEVLATDGLGDLGGLDIDTALIDHLRATSGDEAAWERLLRPASAADRRQWSMFREDVRLVKERLSRHSHADLFIPVLDRESHLTRAEVETLTRPMLARTAKVVRAVIRASELSADRIHGIFLVGGASRMPLAATVVHQETGLEPTVIDQLELVVAHGALLSAAVATAPAPSAPTPPSTAQPDSHFSYSPILQTQPTPQVPTAGTVDESVRTPPAGAVPPQQTSPDQPSFGSVEAQTAYPPPGSVTATRRHAPSSRLLPVPLRVAILLLVLEALIWLWVGSSGDAAWLLLVAVSNLLVLPLLWVKRPVALAVIVVVQALQVVLLPIAIVIWA